jgi:hypothetical protein
MRNKFKTILTILGFLLCQSQSFSQRPNYSGTWILNLQKSQIQANWAKGLTEGVFTIKQDGDKFTLSRYFIIKDKKRKLHFNMIANGKVRRKKILFKGKLEWENNNLQATIFRNGFLNIVNYKFGSNQNEFIADEAFTGRPQDYHNHWVFDKEQQVTQ